MSSHQHEGGTLTGGPHVFKCIRSLGMYQWTQFKGLECERAGGVIVTCQPNLVGNDDKFDREIKLSHLSGLSLYKKRCKITRTSASCDEFVVENGEKK